MFGVQQQRGMMIECNEEARAGKSSAKTAVQLYSVHLFSNPVGKLLAVRNCGLKRRGHRC